MNRRQFFGMTAAAVAAAGLPALVLPERTIFLPPRTGWLSKRFNTVLLPVAESVGLMIVVVNNGATELIIKGMGIEVIQRPRRNGLKDGEAHTFVSVPDEKSGTRWVLI